MNERASATAATQQRDREIGAILNVSSRAMQATSAVCGIGILPMSLLPDHGQDAHATKSTSETFLFFAG
jgi:hypothetical protein